MKEKIKSFVKGNSQILKLYRLYKFGYFFKKSFTKKIKGKNNILKIHKSAILVNCKFKIKGNNNSINIANSCLFKNVMFHINGSNNKIFIEDNVMFFRSGELWIEDDNCLIKIGRNSTFEQAHIAGTESNSKIDIGEDCMFAYGIDIRTGDSHSIIDTISRERINFAKDVFIGNHVWIATHVSIMKGVRILSNSVVATRSVVTKKFNNENILIGGMPAKILRDNITWDRARL